MRGSTSPHPARAALSQGVLFSEAITMSESALVHDRSKTVNQIHGFSCWRSYWRRTARRTFQDSHRSSSTQRWGSVARLL